jgi:hypothetical protein
MRRQSVQELLPFTIPAVQNEEQHIRARSVFGPAEIFSALYDPDENENVKM